MRQYGTDLVKFRVINGAGGDGGIEAYGELATGVINAVEAKWFREILKDHYNIRLPSYPKDEKIILNI